MTDREIQTLMADVDTLYAYQPFSVTASIINRVKAALQELRNVQFEKREKAEGQS